MKSILSFLAISFALFFVACSPDLPEGPDYSIYSIKHKLTRKWYWSRAIENNIVKTAEFDGRTIEFRDDYQVEICYKEDSCVSYKWNLVEKNTALQIFVTDNDSTAYFDILHLSRKECRMESDASITKQDNIWDLRPLD